MGFYGGGSASVSSGGVTLGGATLDIQEFTIKQNDNRPLLRATLLDENEHPLDVTGAVVTLHMGWPGEAAILIGACTIIDAVGGVVEYDWTTKHTVDDSYNAEFQIVYLDGGVRTVPTDRRLLRIIVTPEIA